MIGNKADDRIENKSKEGENMKLRSYLYAGIAAGIALVAAGSANAGVYILDGTDADDHGSASATENFDGWFYIQRGLENIAGSSSLTKTNKSIAVLGADPNTTASQAVQSAVSLSTLLTGWSVTLLNGSEISNFFANGGAGYSVIYMDSGRNVGGGISFWEQAILDANGAAIDNFLGAGGGLFSHAQGYGWLSSLVPGLSVIDYSNTGIALTPAGNANFPGLTDSDLSAGPFHQTFGNVGAIPVLGLTTATNEAVILGGSGGTITVPPPAVPAVPEPATWAMMLMGFGVIGATMRVRRKATRVTFA